jgi:nucleoside-diphosphate-sugar epimerase
MLDKLVAMSTLKDIEVQVDPARLRPSDVTLQVPCVDKFHKATGWKPQIEFDKTLKDTLDYWRQYYGKRK